MLAAGLIGKRCVATEPRSQFISISGAPLRRVEAPPDAVAWEARRAEDLAAVNAKWKKLLAMSRRVSDRRELMLKTHDLRRRPTFVTMAHRLPPLNPLRVFDVVARVQNLTTAAKELHVSQSAVSRQIAALESYLGVELLRRERTGVSLTRAGAAYAKRVAPGIAQIAAATEELLRSTSLGVLRVRTYTTFTAKWLIPRLPDFRSRYPDIEVVVTNAVPDVDFDRDPVDVAIQFGDGRWPRVQTDLLFPDEIEPVCSPAYLNGEGTKSGRPETLLGKRLLVSHYRRSDWDDWLASTGRGGAATNAERMSFSTSVLTWQAALDGLGMAIGQTAMLQSEFQKGTLIRPFRQPVCGSRAYYLVRPANQRFSRRVEAFRDWLLAEAAKTR